MPGNRVEELEATVSELESTVSGLTEELVEAKERIRDLEAELEPDPADGSQFPEADPAEVQQAATQVEQAIDEATDGEGVDSGKTEAPETGDEPTDPEASEPESESESDQESKPGDDIIIA